MAKENVVTTHLVELYNGEIVEITVTNKAAQAEAWMKNINKWFDHNGQKRIIALDCKYIRHPIESMSNKVATLQLCVGNKCLVLQLLHKDCISHFIKDFFCDSCIAFVGVQMHENSRKLLDEYELNLSRKIDLHFLARSWFPVSYRVKPSLKALAYEIAGLSMRTKCGKRNCDKVDWESRVLDEELVERACVDAYASYCVAQKLLKDDM